MPVVRYEQRQFHPQEGETLLDTLLSGGVAAPHSCKSGVCGSCLMRVTEGSVPARAQDGLKDAWKAQGYFLPCVCVPHDDVTVAAAGADAQVEATIASLEALSRSVLRVRVRCANPFEFRAGQYVTLIREGGLARSYSIASLPNGESLELHVRRIPNGRMSGWLFESARPGDAVRLQGPSGECFYLNGREDQPLLLAGAGTGLAPLYGILRDALARGHRGPIHLFHGAVRPEGLYLQQELRALAGKHENVDYTPVVLEGGEAGMVTAPLDRAILTRFPKLDGWRAFVCGDPALVQLLRKRIFLAGAASRDIHADAFVPSAN